MERCLRILVMRGANSIAVAILRRVVEETGLNKGARHVSHR
ncbi:MAG: hypothetical protein AB1665_03045 [Candidatus Thermoplasmatota archaeon]